jgi:hypothetical protein
MVGEGFGRFGDKREARKRRAGVRRRLSFVSLFFPAGYWTTAPELPFQLVHWPFFSFFLYFFNCPFSKMALGREFGQQLRRAVSKATTGEACLAQSRRYISHSTTPWRAAGIAHSSRWNAGAQKSIWPSLQGWKQAQRSFSATAQIAHGHITPPKPGEE